MDTAALSTLHTVLPTTATKWPAGMASWMLVSDGGPPTFQTKSAPSTSMAGWPGAAGGSGCDGGSASAAKNSCKPHVYHKLRTKYPQSGQQGPV